MGKRDLITKMDNLENKAREERLVVTSVGDPYKEGDIFDKLKLKNIIVDTRRAAEYDQAGKTFGNLTKSFNIQIKVGGESGKHTYRVSVYFKDSKNLLAERKAPDFEKALKLYKGVREYIKEREY